MLKKLILAILLATSPEDGAVPHTANIIADVPVANMGDCATFTVAGTVVRKVGDSYRFVVILNCNEKKESTPKENFET